MKRDYIARCIIVALLSLFEDDEHFTEKEAAERAQMSKVHQLHGTRPLPLR